MEVIFSNEGVRIPAWVHDLTSFRRWATSDEFPETGRFSHLDGKLWVDLSMERADHNLIKTEVVVVLGGLIKTAPRGRLFSDGMLLTHPEAELSSEPDAFFVSQESLLRQRAQLKNSQASREVVGTPDMVMEVVSPSSVEKDTLVLPKLYHRAGVPEYWLIDPRGEELIFNILKYEPNGYRARRKLGGWIKSEVFNAAFRLSCKDDDAGLPEYWLQCR